MRAYIRKIQSKKESTRKQIFVLALVLSMSFVGIVWVYSLGFRFNSETAARAQNDIKPFSVLRDSLSDTISNISASVGSVSSIGTISNEGEANETVVPIQ